MKTIQIDFEGETIELPMPEGNEFFHQHEGEWRFVFNDHYASSPLVSKHFTTVDYHDTRAKLICMIAECHFRDLADETEPEECTEENTEDWMLHYSCHEAIEAWQNLRKRLKERL